MMDLLSMEFWFAFQMIIDVILIVLVLYFSHQIRLVTGKQASQTAAEKLLAMMEPVLQETEKASQAFETQLNEKSRIVTTLNEKLDSRIISLNLLLNRAEAHLGGEKMKAQAANVYEQQELIWNQYHGQGMDIAAIARKMQIPQGEVELVLEMKKKFLKAAPA
jgi:hypothetical protein